MLQTFTFGCSFCGAIMTEGHEIGNDLSVSPYRPSLPDGWRSIGGQLACNMHVVKISVKSRLSGETQKEFELS